MRTVAAGPRRSQAATGVVLLAVFLVGCSPVARLSEPPASPANASPSTSPSAAVEPSSATIASPSASAVAAGPSPGATCPVLPADLATIRDVAGSDHALACFGHRSLTFRAYVPRTEGLGGLSAYKMTPAWLADPFTGVIVQPEPLPDQDQNAWLIVRIRPALGSCQVTGEEQPACPLGAYLDGYVMLTGHFDDPSAAQCRSRAFTAGDPAGPSRTRMIATCRRSFVVSAIAPG